MTGRRSSSTPDAPATPRLTWRWPELLVGALSLAVVAGLGGLLLSERLGPRQTADTQPQVVTSVIPSSPGTVTQAATPAASPPAGTSTSESQSAQAGSIPPAPASPPVAKIPPPVLPKPEPIAAPPPVQTPTTAAPTQPSTQNQGQSQAPAQGQPPINSATPAQTTAQTPATATQPSEPATPTAVPRAGGAVAPSEQRTPLRSDYRVMLGTFGSRASLQAATAQVSALGYTVYAIALGNQFVAQVGPYANEAAGREAVADIRRVYGRAELYLPRGQTPSAAATEPEPQTSQTQAPAAEATPPVSSAPAQETTPEPEPAEPPVAAPATPAPAPSGPTYLQVGAFNNPEGAQRFVEQLRAQGFTPSVNAPAGGKVTVLVGPFNENALLEAEGRLDRAGLDHFRLR
ncbi:MAG: SPOR domain-containing protein [Deinococcus sp.]|uniref:SPOR domain-containing protein n=1 Tax=Deinococcus sp. TaxID=47478 RepID=UPI0026DD1375|nr:SPOR domain-containing protein [Deinococcus sp.]MDO4247105.1 SPOR domain-containing protein [Deinococcus sp.]